MIPFNADQIFEMAEQIERNGAKFYRKAAEGAAKGSADMLLELAAMEDDHLNTFQAMRAGLAHAERLPETFDPEGVGGQYLKAMADGKVFDVKADPSEMLAGDQTVQQVLQIAIGLEKESIVFYLGVKDVVPERSGREKIDDIIKQEMGHILTLNKALAEA